MAAHAVRLPHRARAGRAHRHPRHAQHHHPPLSQPRHRRGPPRWRAAKQRLARCCSARCCPARGPGSGTADRRAVAQHTPPPQIPRTRGHPRRRDRHTGARRLRTVSGRQQEPRARHRRPPGRPGRRPGATRARGGARAAGHRRYPPQRPSRGHAGQPAPAHGGDAAHLRTAFRCGRPKRGCAARAHAPARGRGPRRGL